VNAGEAFRLRLQSLLAAGLASSHLAARVGLAAASEVWGGDAPRERPAWYVWLRGLPGAWQVELVAAGALGPANDGTAIVARFTLRHYPAPTGPSFALFSPQERTVAAASLDHTGTPRIELAATIPEALFTVGTIDWALGLEGGEAVFGVASLDRLRTQALDGEVARDVPGWQLSVPMFSTLSGLHAQVERRAASRIVVSRLPGFETVRSDDGEHRDAPELALGEGFVLFPGEDRDPERPRALLRALQDREAEVLHDVELDDAGRRSGILARDPRIALPMNPSWFGGERHVHDRPLCAC
jgi:hypothetical protein